MFDLIKKNEHWFQLIKNHFKTKQLCIDFYLQFPINMYQTGVHTWNSCCLLESNYDVRPSRWGLRSYYYHLTIWALLFREYTNWFLRSKSVSLILSCVEALLRLGVKLCIVCRFLCTKKTNYYYYSFPNKAYTSGKQFLNLDLEDKMIGSQSCYLT